MNSFNLTEASKYLNKSTKTIGRYIKSGRLKTEKVRSKQGTLEYRFTKEDLDNIKDTPDTPDTQKDTPDKQKTDIKQESGIIELLKDNQEMLREQLRVKDEQLKAKDELIKSFADRQVEVNALLLQAQQTIRAIQQEKLQLTEPKKGLVERLFKKWL